MALPARADGERLKPNAWLRSISDQVFAKDILQRMRRRAEALAVRVVVPSHVYTLARTFFTSLYLVFFRFFTLCVFHAKAPGVDTSRHAIVQRIARTFSGSLPFDAASLSDRVGELCASNVQVASRLLQVGSPFANSASPLDLLYMMSMVGVALFVEDGNNAAAINPWRLRLVNVGAGDSTAAEVEDTATALCEMHCDLSGLSPASSGGRGHSIKSTKFVLVTAGTGLSHRGRPADSAAVQHFLRSELYRHYLGVVFAKNPEVQLPGQQSALLFVSFSKLCEQLLRRAPNDHRGRQCDVDAMISVWGAIRDHCRHFGCVVPCLFSCFRRVPIDASLSLLRVWFVIAMAFCVVFLPVLCVQILAATCGHGRARGKSRVAPDRGAGGRCSVGLPNSGASGLSSEAW